ncbi:hypothetical protein Gotur_031530 [Gossypium turneri]
MEKGFLDKVEDNAAVRTWSETTQQEKGDSLADGYELKEIWDQWDDEVRQLFYDNYGDLPYLLDAKVDKHLFRALAQFWNPVYSYFTFGKVDLVPMIEQYWVAARIKQKGDSKCIPWRSLKDAILTHPDVRKRLDVFALNIYGLVIFFKALGHVDEAVTDLFDRLDKRVTLISVILAETFRSLSACRKTGEGRFIGCAQLLLAWFHSHFWKVDKVSYWVFFEIYSPLKEIVVTPRRDDISEEKWMAILQNLQEEDGAVGYAPLLALRQYRSRQFIPATQEIVDCEFSYKDDGYRKKIQEMSIVPSELEIIRQDFERRNADLEKKIEQMEEEKMSLRLDIDIQRLETEKLRKEKNKAKEELEKDKADRWERKFQEMQMRNEALEKSLSDSQREKDELKDRVTELERFLHQYRNQNSAIELKTSLSKIEEMKKRIEELETALQNCEIQIQHLEANESLQADMLSVKYELESDRGQELAVLLRKIRMLRKGSVLNVEEGDSEGPVYPPGYSIEYCTAFKKLVERLISMGVVKVDDSPSTENPLPNHNENGVNKIGGNTGRKIKENIAEVKIPLRWIWKKMVERGLLVLNSERSFEGVENYCEFHHDEGHEIRECTEFRALVQVVPRRGLGTYLERKIGIPVLNEKQDNFGIGYKPDRGQRMKELERRQERRRARLNGEEIK